MKPFSHLFLLFYLLQISVLAQSKVSGHVTDNKGNPISGANVFLEGTYDGTITLDDGSFTFLTSSQGMQTLIASYLSYQLFTKRSGIEEMLDVKITLREDVNSLEAVMISAGTFEADEKARVSVLKPLDIVTTAGSAGDIVAALQTLPGTQRVGESGRLFVRGGEAGETQTFVDGLRVAQPYASSVQNLPSRGRFSPFLFSGISFSTGGYSAEYGDALSSVLLLNTGDLASQTKTEISLMTVGLGLGHTQKWQKSSLSVNTSYINLAPYQILIPQNLNWNKDPESISGEGIYRQETRQGIWKFYAALDASNFDLIQQNINYPNPISVQLENNNFYLNSSYRGTFGNQWSLYTGISYGLSNSQTTLGRDQIEDVEHATHLKAKLDKRISPGLRLTIGADLFATTFKEHYTRDPETSYFTGYKRHNGAVFTEAAIRFSRKLAAQVGVRATYNDLLQAENFSPRLSMAYKTGLHSQVSIAYGNFSQVPGNDYLKFSENFSYEKATHYILNYQYANNRKLFRAEMYYKNYLNLVKYNTEELLANSTFNNNGAGYAKGLDLFWRDGRSIKNMEYWVSYSLIETERDYRNFPKPATPNFVATHNASLVSKYWVQELRSQVGLSYNYSSGRPFHNPNETGFMRGMTRNFTNLNFNWAYLLSQQKILYFSVSNVLGAKNIFGYEYAQNPNSVGIYNRKAITPPADRFFFVGFFWTISSDKKSNQLDTL